MVVTIRRLISFILPAGIILGLTFGAYTLNVDRLDGTPAFEEAIRIIKKYETLHPAKSWPYIGYGHRVLPGETYKKGVVLKEAEADALLRKDLRKYVKQFRSYGDKAILLGVLSYNIGANAVTKSAVMKHLDSPEAQLRAAYIEHCRYKGKIHRQIRQRRIEEFDTLYDFTKRKTDT